MFGEGGFGVNNGSEMQETWVRSPGGEDPLEEGMPTHSSVLAWRIPGTEEEPGGLPTMGSQRVTGMSDQHFHVHLPLRGGECCANS